MSPSIMPKGFDMTSLQRFVVGIFIFTVGVGLTKVPFASMLWAGVTCMLLGIVNVLWVLWQDKDRPKSIWAFTGLMLEIIGVAAWWTGTPAVDLVPLLVAKAVIIVRWATLRSSTELKKLYPVF
jgi:hypothetical protein